MWGAEVPSAIKVCRFDRDESVKSGSPGDDGLACEAFEDVGVGRRRTPSLCSSVGSDKHDLVLELKSFANSSKVTALALQNSALGDAGQS
jgi:hypothetical protein